MTKNTLPKLPTDWKKQMRDSGDAELRTGMTKAIKQSAQIPLGTKTNYPLYIEARTLFLLRELAKLRNVSVQSILRQLIDDYLQDHIFPKEKKTTTKKS